jgi:DNA-binding NarL/FixJ family response regulator
MFKFRQSVGWGGTTTAARPTGECSVLRTLSDSEKDIVACIGNGLSNSEIAERLKIKPTTVRNYTTKIFLKTGFVNRLQIAIFAVREGFV